MRTAECKKPISKARISLARFLALLPLLPLFFTGCSTLRPEPRPDWLVQPQSAYPAARYLSAIGEGDTRRAAENNATAGLARIFQSHIDANETLSQTTTESRGRIDAFDQFSELRTDVKIGSQQELLNVQFGEIFTDRHGRVHIAALLARAETAAIYRTRINENDSSIAQFIRQSQATTKPIQAYALLRAAARKALVNDRLLAQLDIIAPQDRNTLALKYDPHTLYTETAAAAQKITFSLRNTDKTLNSVLTEILTGMGFSENNNSPALRFSGSAEFENMDLHRAALVFVRSRFTLEARTNDDHLALALHGTAREAHISYEEATARAERNLKSDLQSRVPRELGGYFDRLASAE